ncbi:MAG: tail fiber domain-containing protein, partial [Candidatus Krumholzibacteria bacterium]|nr:tail fiber domain-containing protein [Candidatus Krumholzibacteria bacterium]
GVSNDASGEKSVVGGGVQNIVSGDYATVGGGESNLADGDYAVIASGRFNVANGGSAAIGGGEYNSADGEGATVPGGANNVAAGGYSFAAGRMAQANHGGSFVWADSIGNTTFASTANDQFLIRAAGGVGIGTNTPTQELDVAGSVKMQGFDMPVGGAAGYVLTSDAIGQGSWQPVPGGSAWGLSGNAGTTPGTDFLGTTDNQALELHVNGDRVLRLEPHVFSPNIIAGYSGNSLLAQVRGTVIAGGGANGASHLITDDYSVVGGGAQNVAGDGDVSTTNSPYIPVGGGEQNTASAGWVVIGGGYNNNASATGALIGGGIDNLASGESAAIGGGTSNTASGHIAVVAGGGNNQATLGAAVVGGGYSNVAGGEYSVVSGGNGNTASSRFAAVSGGYNNQALGAYSAIGGGFDNQATDSTSTIGGGEDNSAAGHHATVAGGQENHANNTWAAIGGGQLNQALNVYATVGGGYRNRAHGYGATVVGGMDNFAQGDYSVAAGSRVRIDALHHGAIVMADSSDHFFYSVVEDEFAVRATGGVRLVTAVHGSTGAPSAGATLAAGSGTWGTLSDRNAKTNFETVDEDEILERVAGLEISTWNYKAQDPSVRHIGPMAQDFYAAFSLGPDDKRITTVDADGVSLAAIQALNKKLTDIVNEVKEKDAH